MRLGDVMEAVRHGARAYRHGWNGKDMWIAYSPGHESLPAEAFWSHANQAYARAQGGYVKVNPCVTMKCADGSITMGWLASQTDLLADDWEILV